MLDYKNAAAPKAATAQVDLTLLAERLGAADLAELAPAATAFELQQVRTLPGLREFLRDYAGRVLTTVELPAIRQAFQHASRCEARELIALDREVAKATPVETLARASRHVGRSQLRKLRPVRDQRFVQRYVAAVESGEARGWHTVVFGMVLALYALPLRQGLMHYALQTVQRFIQSAAGPLRLRAEECDALFAEIAHALPEAVERALAADQPALRLLK